MKNKTVRIVTLGDSMTASAGEDNRQLEMELARHYPGRRFELFNYGFGGTRAGYGLWRLTHEYKYGNQKRPSLVSLEPDVVLLESFAYNNASDGMTGDGLRHFRNMHRRMVAVLREKTHARIVFVVTIAPEPDRFVETVPNFYYTPVSIRRRMALDRTRYLKEGIRIAEELKLPLVNVYQATLNAKKKGVPLGKFINPSDWIHPSTEGHALTARLVVETFKRYGIIEGI
jgi:lysophospholipase L1-like esterase